MFACCICCYVVGLGFVRYCAADRLLIWWCCIVMFTYSLMGFDCVLAVADCVVCFRFSVLWACDLVLRGPYLRWLCGCLFVIYFVMCGFNSVVLCRSLCL